MSYELGYVLRRMTVSSKVVFTCGSHVPRMQDIPETGYRVEEDFLFCSQSSLADIGILHQIRSRLIPYKSPLLFLPF